MQNELLELKEIGNLVLDLFTIEELVEKGIKPIKFKWKFNLSNINLIPLLELYNNEGKIFKTLESTEFSRMLQELLRETQLLFNCTNNIHYSKTREGLLSYIDEVAVDCSECDFRNVCPIRND